MVINSQLEYNLSIPPASAAFQAKDVVVIFIIIPRGRIVPSSEHRQDRRRNGEQDEEKYKTSKHEISVAPDSAPIQRAA